MGHERGLLHCISIVLVCVACRLGAADAAAVPVPASAPPFSDQDAPQRAPAPAPGTAELSEALPPAMQGPGADQFGRIVALNCTVDATVCGSGQNQLIQNLTYRFIGDNFTPDNSSFLKMIQNMQPELKRIEAALSVNIQMTIRPSTPAVIYGPDGINGSKIAYAPTPGQVPLAAPSMRGLLQIQEEPAQVDDLSMRFSLFQSTDVELNIFGNASSSLLDFYNNTALQNFGAVLRGDIEGVTPMPLNISMTFAILPLAPHMDLTPKYVLGTVLQVTGASQFPVSTQTQVLLLRGLQDLCSKNGTFLYHRLQAVWADQATSIVRHALLTYVTVPMESINRLTGTDIGTLMNQLAPQIGANFTVFVQFSVFLGNYSSELEGSTSFVLDVSDPPQKKAQAPVLNWWQILLVCLGGVAFVLLIAGLLFALITVSRQQRRYTQDRLAIGTPAEPVGPKFDGLASSLDRVTMHQMFDCSTPTGSAKGQSSKLTSMTASIESHRASFVAAGFEPDWAISEDDLVIFQEPDGSDCILGEGSFGCVYKGSKKGELVAIKQLRELTEMDLESFGKEMALLNRLAQFRDTNLVQFLGMCFTPMDSMLVLEYVSGGNLCDAVMNDKAGDFRWDARGAKVLNNVAQGLAFLHGKGIVHGDMKCRNILLTTEGAAKIADTGLSKLVGRQLVSAHLSSKETFAYAAPELVLHDVCTFSSDIYSFGVIMWEVLTHELPIRGSLRAISVPFEAPEAVADLVEQCLAYEPLARPTASDVLGVLQRASSLVVWWGGRLHTVPEVSESGLQTGGSSRTQSVSTATRTASRTSSQPLGQIQEAADIHLNEEKTALQAQYPSHPGPPEGTLLHIKRIPGDSTSTSRNPSDDSTAPDSSPSDNDVGFMAISEALASKASSITHDMKTVRPVSELITDTSQSAIPSSRGTPDPLSPERIFNDASTSPSATALKTGETELQDISEAAEALLDSTQALKYGSAATSGSTGLPPMPKSVFQMPKAIVSQEDGALAEKQPSMALSALSDDSRGKEHMARETFAELQQNPPILLNSQFERSSMGDARTGINQGEEPVASWERSSQERSSQADTKSVRHIPPSGNSGSYQPLLNQTF